MDKINVGTVVVIGAAGLFFALHKSRAGDPVGSAGATPNVSQGAPQPAGTASAPPVAPGVEGAHPNPAGPHEDLATAHVQLQILASTSINMLTGGRGIQVSLAPVGPMQERVRAGRVTITHALDNDGALLTQETTNKFYSVSAGRTDDSKDLTSREAASFSLTGLSKDAKSLISILGVLELVVPDLDPNSTATVAALPSKFGSAIVSEALSSAEVTVSVFDKPSAYAAAASNVPGGPQDYDAGPFFGPVPPLPPGFRKPTMGDGDIAFGIDDPNDRLIGVEIQAADGSPLNYNHGGNYHSSGFPGSPGKRFDTYHLGSALPTDARLVCWLLTPASVLRIPFQIDQLPIPTSGGGPNSVGMITVQVAAAASATRNAFDYDKAHSDANSTPASSTGTDRIARLWADVPEYLAIIKRDMNYRKLPKLLSSVAPAPAAGTVFPQHGFVKVSVSFFVDATGKVEAARVLDSNDTRFNISAVTAVLQWRFKPAETDAGPAMAMVVVPFIFNATVAVPP